MIYRLQSVIFTFLIIPFISRRSTGSDELQVKIGLDQYTVPPNIRTAVNHSVDSKTSTSGAVAKDAAQIRFLQFPW